ncbi:hypothetical protein BDV12DRAFT_148089 [Aspergillus spectabilis]
MGLPYQLSSGDYQTKLSVETRHSQECHRLRPAFCRSCRGLGSILQDTMRMQGISEYDDGQCLCFILRAQADTLTYSREALQKKDAHADHGYWPRVEGQWVQLGRSRKEESGIYNGFVMQEKRRCISLDRALVLHKATGVIPEKALVKITGAVS